MTYPYLKPVAVIASFSKEGKIQPLYIRIEEESYKILKYTVKDYINPWISFRCTILDTEQYKEFTLNYNIEDFKWNISIQR